MRLHRFIGNFDFENERIRIEDSKIVKQIRNVLRLRSGDVAILSDGKLNEAEAKIVSMEKDFLEMELLIRKRNDNEPAVKTILYCSILKKENFELIAQKATEIGISKIVPVVTSRTVKTNLKQERLGKIIKEASEQSERGIIPELVNIMSFSEAVGHAGKNHLNIFFDRNGDDLPEKDIYSIKMCDSDSIGIFIGPEGGWDNSEVEMAKDAEFSVVSMGKLNLRAETAAIIGSYLAVNGYYSRKR